MSATEEELKERSSPLPQSRSLQILPRVSDPISFLPRSQSAGALTTRRRQFSMVPGLEEERTREVPRQLFHLQPKLTVIPEFKCVSARRMPGEAPIPGFDRYIFHLSAPDEKDEKKEGDTLTIVSMHATGHRRLILKTRSPKIAAALPNKLVSSLTGKLEQQLQKYQLCIDGYRRQVKRYAAQGRARVTTELKDYAAEDENSGLSPVEKEKAQIIQELLEQVRGLKAEERQISGTQQLSKTRDASQQEAFRNRLFKLIAAARSKNREATNTFATGEGYLNSILYDAEILCLHYEFDPHTQVTLADQNDFSEKEADKLFLWDSDENMEGSDEDIQTALFTIVKVYDLEQDFNDEENPHFHPLHFEESSRLGRADQELGEQKKAVRQAATYLAGDPALAPQRSSVTRPPSPAIRTERVIVEIPEEGRFVKPSESDLFVVADLAKRNLYWWHRVVIQLKLLRDRIPVAIRYEIVSAKRWFRNVWRRFNKDIDEEYTSRQGQAQGQVLNISAESKEAVSTQLEGSLRAAQFKGVSLLGENESLEDFIQAVQGSYHLVKPDHKEAKTEYHNPVSVGLHIVKAFGNFFRHHSEKNPITGTLGLAAYAYGAGAVVAPAALAAFLSKLHLYFLTAGIQPTQGMASMLASGPDGRAIAAGFTYWKAVAVSADIDSFLIESIKQLEDDPVSVVFIVGVAIGLGYTTCKMIPAFEEELGTFPLYGELIMGFKVGAGLADTIYNPHSNVFSKILSWVFSIPILAVRTIIDPIVETWRHEENNWILKGVRAFLNDYFFKSLDYLFDEYPEAGFFTVLFASIIMVMTLSVAVFGFLLPRWATTTEKPFAENTFFQFGMTLFSKDGYNFLPEFLEYDCYDDYSVFHPVRIVGRLFTMLVNFLFLLFYILAPALKIIAFITSFVLPTYFTSKPFAKAMKRLFKKLAEGLDGLFNIILTVFKLLFDELPGFLHIIYRGIAKLIAKILGTLGEPGLLANLLIRFATRKLNTHFSREGKFKLRWNPNYGFDKESWYYINSGIAHWPLVLHFLFFIVAAPLLLLKDILKNLFILISDMMAVSLRFFVLLVDLVSRAVAIIVGGIFKFLDILMNPDRYLNLNIDFRGWLPVGVKMEFIGWRGQKPQKNAPVFTLGYVFRELGKAVIYLTDAIDRFFGKIKRSFLSGITRAEIESRRQLLPATDEPAEERQRVFAGLQAQTLARLLIVTGDSRAEQGVEEAAAGGQDTDPAVADEIPSVPPSTPV